MKVTLNWLKQYVDFNWSPEELTRRLTLFGLEISSRLAATEWRQPVAHSVSYGLDVLSVINPGGAAESNRTLAQFLSPLRGLNRFSSVPTISTVGYYRSLLRSEPAYGFRHFCLTNHELKTSDRQT